MKKIAFAVAALSAIPGVAAAQGAYVEVGGGSSFAGTLDGDNVDDLRADFGAILPINIDEDELFDFKPGFVGYVAAGYEAGLGLRVEAEGVALHNQLKTQGITDATALTYAGFVNAVFAPNLNLVVRPYIGAGVGYAATNVEFEFLDQTVEDDGSAFAWQVKAGAEMDVSPNVVLTSGYRFMSATFEEDADGVDADLRVHAATVGVRFKTAQ